MKLFKQTIKNIEDIPSNSHKDIMLLVVKHLFKYQNIKEIGISDVKKLTSKEYYDTDILLSLQKLCLLKYPILELEYEFFENEYNNFIIKNSTMKEAEKNSFLIHPNTGRCLPLNIWNKNIFINFKVKKYEKYKK